MKHSIYESELEFVIFCIEEIADKLNLNGSKVYANFAKNKVIEDYLVPNYEVLHTQSKEYIINDIFEYLEKRGIILC